MKVRNLGVLAFSAASAAALATAMNDATTGLPSLTEEDLVSIDYGADGTNFWAFVTYAL